MRRGPHFGTLGEIAKALRCCSPRDFYYWVMGERGDEKTRAMVATLPARENLSEFCNDCDYRFKERAVAEKRCINPSSRQT